MRDACSLLTNGASDINLGTEVARHVRRPICLSHIFSVVIPRGSPRCLGTCQAAAPQRVPDIP